MSTEILMPALSPTMSEGKLAKWLVKEGDIIKAGDLLAEIETDKAIMEFESSEDGTLKKILINEGVENIKVNEPIALLETSNSLVDENSPKKIVNEKEYVRLVFDNNNVENIFAKKLFIGTGSIQTPRIVMNSLSEKKEITLKEENQERKLGKRRKGRNQ